jgi:hypothetical protein
MYPDTQLGSDVLDDEVGGQPISEFGIPAFQFVHSALRFLSRAYLTYLRAPCDTIVVVSQSSAAAGDVAIFAAGEFVVSSGYYASKYASGLTAKFALGIYLEPVGAGAKARVARGGVIAANLANVGVQTAAQDAGLNTATGRLRVAQLGDVVLGTFDIQGNLLFHGHGVAL